MLVLSAAELERVLDWPSVIEAVARAHEQFAAGAGLQPERLHIEVTGERGVLLVMPAYLPQSGALATKLVTVFPKNPSRRLPLVEAVVILNDVETGAPLALLEGTTVTARRTAAASAVATRALALPDARVLCLIGAGVQARAHLHAIAAIRPVAEVRVVGRTPASGTRFRDELQPLMQPRILASASVREAVSGADIVVTATTSPTPVLEHAWIRPGAHINAVGAFSAQTREVDSATVAAAHLVVGSRTATLKEAGDLAMPLAEGVLTRDHPIHELGAILAGKAPGRPSPEAITLYKSVGMAVEDAATARLAYERARAQGLGTNFQLR
jgi:ornithine cyclodeaminase/alanine dehydrogenase-like protein (mu-crystallin family)